MKPLFIHFSETISGETNLEKKKLNFFIWKLEFFEIFDLLKLSMLKINSSQVSETFLYMLEIHTIFLSDFVEKIKEFVERKQRLLIRR